MAKIKRFGALKDSSRQAYCKSCRAEIAPGTTRYYDNHAATFGPACLMCVGKAGGAEVQIEAEEKGQSGSDARIDALEKRVAALEAAQTVAF